MEDLPSQEKLISFEDLASAKGYSPQRPNRGDFKNVSHILKAKGSNGKPINLRFDVKKIKNLKQSQDWMWIEFKNSNLAKKAKYRIYKRAGKKEEITQINIKDIKDLESCQIWLKKDAASE